MKFLTAQFSCIGTRDTNEDCMGYISKRSSYGVWAVADGLGGHSNGEVASKCAVDEVLSAFAENKNIEYENAMEIMSRANRAVWLKQGEEHGYDSMKTTLAAVFMRRGRISIAHAGDSRVYIFRKNRIVFQTRDDTLCQLQMEDGEPGDVRFMENRNQLLCALGAYSKLIANATENPIALKRGDAILLCTDGFWERILEEKMEDTLSISATPERWLQIMRMHLERDMCPRQDNYTAMAVMIK